MKVLILGMAGLFLATPHALAAEEKDAFYCSRLLGRGMNLANALEAPKEGDWGVKLEAAYFQKIKDAGFDSVRIPIRWSAHARKDAPYTIDPAFFKRIDWAVAQALMRKLAVVINFHHYESLEKKPEQQLPRFLGLWKQVAHHYRNQSERVIFELLNEPHDPLNDERWNDVFPKLLAVVRQSNPRRAIIIGPSNWNSLDHLDKLKLPERDRLLIATFHYYNPFKFTHQGADWVPKSKQWLGTTWTGTEKQMDALRHDFTRVATWAQKQRRPIYLGEFGTYVAADMASRARWTRAVVGEAGKHGFSWAYWEFGAGFGAYDLAARAWRRPLLDALLDKQAN